MIYTLLIGFLVGFLASKLMRGDDFGILGNIALGLAGSFAGWLLFGLLGFSSYGLIGDIVSGTVGAVILIVALGELRRRR